MLNQDETWSWNTLNQDETACFVVMKHAVSCQWNTLNQGRWLQRYRLFYIDFWFMVFHCAVSLLFDCRFIAVSCCFIAVSRCFTDLFHSVSLCFKVFHCHVSSCFITMKQMQWEWALSFLLTYLDIQDQPEQCKQIINPFTDAEPSHIQPSAAEKSSGQTMHVDTQVLSTSLPSGLTAKHGTFAEALKASILTPSVMSEVTLPSGRPSKDPTVTITNSKYS